MSEYVKKKGECCAFLNNGKFGMQYSATVVLGGKCYWVNISDKPSVSSKGDKYLKVRIKPVVSKSVEEQQEKEEREYKEQQWQENSQDLSFNDDIPF